MRIGEYLIQQGLLDQAQLEAALKAQLIYGGHLGTCLVELGYLDEGALGRALAETFRVEYATPDMLVSIPPPVIQALPAKAVEKHHAVPFHLKKNTLRVAMIDPKNLPALDEISFASGTKMEPWVAPEARIFQAMEKYYDIPRRQRFISICRNLDRTQKGGETPATVATGPPAGGRENPILAQQDSGGTGWKTTPPDDSGPSVTDAMCGAETMGDLAEVVIDFASQRMERCILFSVKSDQAVVWRSRAVGFNQDKAKLLTFPICEEPIFQLLLGEGEYRGALPDEPRYRKFFESLGLEFPAEVLMFAIHFEDRLVAIFYGDGEPSSGLGGEMEEYRRLLRKFTLAFYLIPIKEKIRSL